MTDYIFGVIAFCLFGLPLIALGVKLAMEILRADVVWLSKSADSEGPR